MRQFTTAAALFLAASLYPAIGLETSLLAGERTGGDRINVQHDSQRFVSRVTITAKQGRVAWTDIVRGVARVRGYDDQALVGTLPGGSVRLNSHLGHFMLRNANRMLGDGVNFCVVPARSSRDEPTLIIEMDHEAMLASQRQVKRRLRESLLPDSYEGRDFGIRVHSKSLAASDSDRLVVFIHGLNSHPHTVRRLCAIAQEHGLACAEFQYPNDQAIETSGKLLAWELDRWRKLHPRQEIALVTHSMGGLVARVALETPGLDPGNVDRLIMVAPPNRGCELAQFAFGLDLWEYMDGRELRDKKCLFYSSIEDGLSEATVDLQPGSIFLTKLNRRQRNPDVKYTIFLGTGAPCKREDLNEVRGLIAKLGRRCKWAKFVGSRIDRPIADLDEVVRGKGDGAVAVKRGRLSGVKDTHVMGFGHLSVLYDTDDPEVKKLYDEVLKRLKSS